MESLPGGNERQVGALLRERIIAQKKREAEVIVSIRDWKERLRKEREKFAMTLATWEAKHKDST